MTLWMTKKRINTMREIIITYLLMCWVCHIVIAYLALGDSDESE